MLSVTVTLPLLLLFSIKYIENRPGHDERMSISNYKLTRFILGIEEGRL